MKHFMHSTIKCTGEIDTFLYTGPNKVSMCSVDFIVFYNPTEENIQRSEIWRTTGPENVSLFLSSDKENSLSRKSRAGREKCGGVLCNWKFVSTGAWRKAVFSITTWKFSEKRMFPGPLVLQTSLVWCF
jgi:hypothetical protein